MISGQYVYPYNAVKNEKVVFAPDIYDFYFALFAFILGYLYSRWILFAWTGWGVALFTVLYLIVITTYFMVKDKFVNDRTVWFWFAVTMIVGSSYALFDNPGFSFVRALFLFCSAVYYVMKATGRTILGRTGNYLLIDGINSVIIIPLRNFINQYISLSVPGKKDKRSRSLSVIIGTLTATVMFIILIPLLIRADGGGFRVITDFISDIFTFYINEFIFYVIFAIPVAAYIFALVSGAAHGRHTGTFKLESVEKRVKALRFTQPVTIYIVLGAVCILYLIFIFSQIPYFFSAFTGSRPDGWLIFSEYARHGFFELCTIAVINLVLLTVSNLVSKKRRDDLKTLKIFNVILAVTTLVLIATAFSKMALYIDAYGLTMPRLLPCVFMIFLAAIFIALIILQKREFSIVRFALIIGSVIICTLCMTNPDAIVVRYNSDRYIAGTLKEYDVEILYRAGAAGVLPAFKVMEQTTDPTLKHEINEYLIMQSYLTAESHRSSLESYRARNVLSVIR